MDHAHPRLPTDAAKRAEFAGARGLGGLEEKNILFKGKRAGIHFFQYEALHTFMPTTTRNDSL